jgi:hypothetical protein
MTKRLRIGYVPLTDAALLHVAKAQHFAAARGELRRRRCRGKRGGKRRALPSGKDRAGLRAG